MNPNDAAAPADAATIAAPAAQPLGVLLDVPLAVTVVVGRADLTVAELLRLGSGSVIQLDRLAGEPVEVLVGERRLAEGEIVLVGESLGVRITRVHDHAALAPAR